MMDSMYAVMIDINDYDGFEQAADPLIQWLATHCHPHTKVLVTSTGAELLEGCQSYNTTEFLVD